MPTLHIARGIQASGKTTFARAWVAEDTEHRARVNRDDLRALLHGGYAKEIERRVIHARDALITSLLAAGVDVFCDDTNLPSRTVRDLMKVAAKARAAFQVHDFTDVPLDLCVARDAARPEPVGEQVIRDTWARFIKGRTLPLPLPEDDDDGEPLIPYEAKPGTPLAVMVDVDGTVALLNGRSPYEEAEVIHDLPNRPVIAVVRALHGAGHRIVIMSGRTAGCRAATVGWLNLHLGVPFDGPFMRAEGDIRKDAAVKAELFDQYVRDAYDIACVLDDRRQVVDMWRSLGLTVLQVAEGDF